jgi:RimJ/RimL family protein N-acetyltransferase
MISITRTRDYSLLWRIALEPAIYATTSDDFAPPPSRWKIAEREDFVYLVAFDGVALLGFCAFYPLNGVTHEAHLCFLARGQVNRDAFALMLAWMWKNTRVERICGAVPAYNRAAIQFAIRAGFREYGRNPRCWMKNGKLHDQVLLGISRPDNVAEKDATTSKEMVSA